MLGQKELVKSHARNQHVALETTPLRALQVKFAIVADATIVLLGPPSVLAIKGSISKHAQTTNNVTQLDVSQEQIKIRIWMRNRCVVVCVF